jgi:hypothetical protein
MPLRVIEVDPAETFYSLRDRLLRGPRERTALLLPQTAAPLSGLDLVLLRRLADQERLDVGLVTDDGALAQQARALGLPAFASVGLAELFRPGWWRAGRRAERIGFAPGQDRRPPTNLRQSQPDPSTASQRRARRLAGLLLALIILALLAAALFYFLPQATVTLNAAARSGQVILDLTADPAATASAGSVISAREIRRDQAWEASGAATGGGAGRRRLRALALQGLHAQAPAYLQARLEPGEFLVENSVAIEIIDESFVAAGETISLTLTVVARGLAVNEAHIHPIALRELAGALPDGFAPDPTTLRLAVAAGAASPANGFRVTAQVNGRAEIDQATVAETLRGHSLASAERYLAGGLPADSFTVDIWPGWWRDWAGRMPVHAGRITVKHLP